MRAIVVEGFCKLMFGDQISDHKVSPSPVCETFLVTNFISDFIEADCFILPQRTIRPNC